MRRYVFVLLSMMLFGMIGVTAQDVLQVTGTTPAPGAILSPDADVVFTFNQALDCDTAADALRVQPPIPGDVTCDDVSLTFTPTQNYQAATTYQFIIETSIRGADGARLVGTLGVEFRTASLLGVTEVLPENGTTEVSTNQEITVIFNRPVVPLGIVSDMQNLPNPLSFSPEVTGQGEWLNTSIYVFQPEPGWAPGTLYTATVDAGLEAVDGTTLAEAYSWTFTTQQPRVVSFRPESVAGYEPLDVKVQVVFSTPVDRESFEQNFYLRPEGQTEGTVSGTFEWSDDTGTDYEGTGAVGVAFTPDDLLMMETRYVLGFPSNSVFDATGTASFPQWRYDFFTVPKPAIISTTPFDGEQDVQPFGSISIAFVSPMDQDTLNDKVTIEPEPWREPEFYYQTYNEVLTISFPIEPSTDYTVTVAPGMADVYGNTIDTPLTFSFRTAPYSPDVTMEIPGPVGFYNAAREETQLFVTHRNVSRLDLSLYSVPLANFVQVAANENGYYDPTQNFTPDNDRLLKSWQIESVAPQNARRYELLSLGSQSESGTTPICSGSPPTRLQVGDSAIVISEPDPLRARSAPTDGEIVELLYRDYVLPVVDGPVCDNDLLWWEVQLRDDRNAWIAEGVGEEYFIDLHSRSATTPVTIPQEFTNGEALTPGVYYLTVNSPETRAEGYRELQHFLLVSTANLTVKTAMDSVTIWATEVQTGQPIPDAPITLRDSNFNVLAEGVTDADGILDMAMPPVSDLYVPRMAVLETDAHFGLSLTNWSEGIDPWRFGQPSEFYPQRYRLYLYTDRPVYRPDQPVYFRGVVRAKDDVTYTQPEFDSVPVQIFDDQGEIIYDQPLELTEYGTFSDSFELADDAALGFYRISVNLESQQYRYEGGSVFFNVAEYRLPEFEVNLEPAQEEVVQGETIQAQLESRYFFGGVVADAVVEYNVIAEPYSFNYEGPGGRFDFTDFNVDGGPGEFYGSSGGRIASGQGTTDDQGNFLIEVPADLEGATQSQRFTIEATVRDESDQTVAGRTEVVVHQGEVYVGVRPESYVGIAGGDTVLNFIAVDWDSQPVADQEIDIEIVERRWSSVQEEDPSGRTVWTWEVEEVPVTDAQVTTGEDGRADYTFITPYGGVFKIIATTRDAQGNEVRSSTTMWVSSRDYVTWRQQNSNRIDLVSDANEYEIGDTAEILITSPFQGEVEALVTVERGDTLTYERITMDSNSYVYELPITENYAPNVFVSVFIVKGVDETNPVAGFRMGLIELGVENNRKEIQIAIEPDTEQAGPGDTVTYTLTATDYAGEPVQAEIGVGLTDVAALSLADPNSGPILDYFYGGQSISVRTATPLTINTDQLTQEVLDTIKGGGGGFGEGGIFDIREEFVDTAYWNGALVTDENGVVTFDVTLPDNLTRWRLDARAVTSGDDGLTLVGQDTFDLQSTKPLLIRPVTPRFFVVDDTVSLAAIVNNNTDEALSVEVTLDAEGVTFEDDMTQTVVIPAGGGQRVDWLVTVENVADVDLTFFARSEDDAYTDASKPPLGQGEERLLPVYQYEAPEITGTGGLLDEGGTRTEAIVLPQQFDVTQGELTIRVEPSLAATALEGLDYLRNYDHSSAEATISRMLPNVMTFRALESFGLVDDELRDNLNREVQIAVQRLNAQQKVDGGWGWFVQDQSNPLVTAYAVIGLVEARDSGFVVDQAMIDRAVSFLNGQFQPPSNSLADWRLDRQVFLLYALAKAGSPDVTRTAVHFDARARMSVYAKALLAQTLDIIGGNEDRIATLRTDLQNLAITSANGIHWEENTRDFWNWNTNTRTTAMVLATLVRLNPESDLIPNVVRWLMVARSADAWETTQETAWVLLALTDWMVASGELDADYDYSVLFNDDEIASGTASRDNVTEARELIVDVAQMLADEANRLTFDRTSGNGNLYYTAYLRAFLPVPEIEPLNRGIIVERRYTLLDDPDRETITSANIGEIVQVRLTVIAPNDLHYVVIEDPIPAGTDAVNPDLAISQQVGTRPGLEENDPLRFGWGWWWFSNIDFRDEKVVLNATYLPAGTYEYVYTIRPGLTGEYNVMPPTAREFYFPDVFGRGAGGLFTVLPAED